MGQPSFALRQNVRNPTVWPSWLVGPLGVIACICLALVVTEVWQLWRLHDANVSQAEVMTSTTARSMAEQAETTIKTADTIVASIVERVETEGTGPEARQRLYGLMTSLAVALPAIHEMGFMDRHGDAVVKSLMQNPSGFNYAERNYFRFHAAHRDRGPYIGGRIKSKIDGSSAITVTRRVNNPDGSFAGVVVASVSMAYFQQLFDQMQSRSGGIIALIGADDCVLARSPRIMNEQGAPTAATLLRLQMDNQSSGVIIYTSTIDATRRLGSYQHLRQFPLVVLVAQSQWDVQHGWRAELAWHAVILACVMIVLIIVGRQAIRTNRVLNIQAMQDGLTGLANRRSFGEAIEREHRRAKRTGQPLSLIMIDIDHFKDYNDCYGHPRGDDCLRSVARTIQGCLRRGGDLAARYGGEEIALLLPGTSGVEASVLAETVRHAVHQLALTHPRNRHGIVTFSAGAATYEPENSMETWHALVRDADMALYAAKTNGRDRLEASPTVRTRQPDGVQDDRAS